MSTDNIKDWVHRAKESDDTDNGETGIRVIRKEQPKNRGALIMDLAEKLRPAFQNFFRDRRDLNGTLFQPAHVRAIALNYAEYIIKSEENNAAA